VRKLRAILILGLVFASLPNGAQAAPAVTLSATLTPERLGKGTTIGFAFQIAAPSDQIPPPVTGIEVLYPANLGIASSGLGLETCTAEELQVAGAGGCPPDSRMGFGRALAEVQFGPEIVKEPADVEVVRAPNQKGHIALLFYADGVSPLSAQIVVPGELAAAPAPFGGAFDINVPLVPSLPEAPDVALTRLSSTIGPLHLTYYEQVNGRRVAYQPRGILLPNRCPRGGFPFAATFTFLDGSRASAHTAVPCPRPRPKPQTHGK
jgi:hypothetical protein